MTHTRAYTVEHRLSLKQSLSFACPLKGDALMEFTAVGRASDQPADAGFTIPTYIDGLALMKRNLHENGYSASPKPNRAVHGGYPT